MDKNTSKQYSATDNVVDLLFQQACFLDRVGKTADAKNTYVEVLSKAPSHVGALNNLGTLLYRTGYRTAAKTAYEQAVALHPDHPMSHVNLANILLEEGNRVAAQKHYESALQVSPDYMEAHQGLSYVFAELGDDQRALFHRQQAFQSRPIIELPYYGEDAPVSVLEIVSAVGGNTPTRNVLDDRIFKTYVVIAEFCAPGTVLPPHQLVFNAIGDADLSAKGLIAAESLLKRTSTAVINKPSAVLSTGRVQIAQRFSSLPGIVTPNTVLMPRETLMSIEVSDTLASHGFKFPILLRSPGFHTGRNFLRVDSPDELLAAVETLPGRQLFVIQYLDARGSDGKVRKYRVMMINGQLYPLHLAISQDWKVHYYTADMANNPLHQAEEAEFLTNMPAVLGPLAMESLLKIQDKLGLDYAGIDFALSNSGEVLLFEANATMVVNPPTAEPEWNYRRHATHRIFGAIRDMLLGYNEKKRIPLTIQ